MATDRDPQSPASGARALHWLVTLAIPVLVFGACEGVARLAVSSGAAPDPRLTLVDVPSFFEETVVNGVRHYRIAHPEVYSQRGVVFPAEKPAGSLRVFCLGGSASAGWPHPKQEIYSAYLEQALARAFPWRPIQVINASAHAYAAYRVRLLFDQVIELDPDLIVVYSGNNEFLEKRTYLPHREQLEPFLDVANSLAGFRLARAWLGPRLFPENALSAQKRQHVAFAIWSKVKQVALDLRTDPEQFAQVKSHYRRSIEAIAEGAQQRGVPLVLVSVPVNLRDWHPNVSVHAPAGGDREKWKRAYDSGRIALLRNEPGEAALHFESALAMDPGHAESHFLLARALDRTQEWERAYAHYDRARDLDHNPFRAISEFNDALHDIAARHPGVYLADAEAAFRSASAPRAPGFDLLPDVDRRFGPSPSPSYDESTDMELQSSLLLLFALMHQNESLVARARVYAAPAEPPLELADTILEIFPEVLEIDRRRLLGLPVDPARAERVADRVERFYWRNFPILAEAGANVGTD
jgi:tetratricopeptide (TPR) repeat protein